MPKQKLFDEDSEEEEVSLKTENQYAKKYDKWREKEELHKLEQKYGSKVLSSDASASSDSEDESDEPPEVSEEMEAQFLKTLALLKTKDPRIYNPEFKFFDDKEEKKEVEKPKEKTLTFEDSDDDDSDNENIFKVEKKAEIGSEKPDKESTGDVKKNLKGGKIKDFLTGKAEHIDEEVEQDLAPLKALWSDPKLNEGEAFLRDYILNKRYLDEDSAVDEQLRDDAALEEDAALVEEQGKFERAYNFRFEEPDQEYLKRYPRTMNFTRPKDDRRARKRAEVRARKEEEKKRKMDEIGRLKALKLKEIQEKIAKIKEVTGNQDLAFEEQDIEGDFDPEEHDRRMKALFDEEYYGEADERKPLFPELDEELEIENWDKYEDEDHDVAGEQNQHDDEPHCEDEDFNMDAEYDPKQARANLLQEIQSTLGKKRRNRKKKSKLAQLLASEKPKFVPTLADKTYDQYMDEYYKMDCEDVIGGDLPTRFKYREVVPNDYGLSIEEILLADDKELTQWVPLKKVVRHRAPAAERSEVHNYRQKAADASLIRKVLPSLFKELPQEPEVVVPIEEAAKKKKKKIKKNKDQESRENIQETEESELNVAEREERVDQEQDVSEVKSKKKNNKHKEDHQEESNVDTSRKLEYNKKKNNKKHKESDDTVDTNVHSEVVANVETENKKDEENVTENITKVNGESNADVGKKKKKKKRLISDGFVVENIQKVEPSQTGNEGIKINKNKKNKPQENGQKPNLKRKLDQQSQVPTKKQKKEFYKFKQKEKIKKEGKDQRPMNPLCNLSDERLKAYGLNPKKYKNFLKFKKF